MKILQINVWSGRIKDGLSRFIAEGEYDVVCMQEALWGDECNDFLEEYTDTVDKIQRLGGFPYVAKASNYGTKTLNGSAKYELGNAILSKIPFTKVEKRDILGEYSVIESVSDHELVKGHGYTAQKVILENGIAIINHHGYWREDPLGNETSIESMRRLADFIKENPRPTIVCGDFNIISESPAMRELDFLEDLTATNHLKTTLRNVRFVIDVACDHILISNDLKCTDFKTVSAPISDHMALIAEINQK